jgi:hypothetical protein
LRDALGKPDNGDWSGVDVRRIEQNQIARSVDRIKGEDRQIAVIFGAVGFARNRRLTGI